MKSFARKKGRKARMKGKLLVKRLHLWLGLTSGLIVSFLGITGCMLAFQREIENTFQSYRYVTDNHQTFLPPSQLKAVAEQNLPGKHVHAVMYNGRERAAEVIFFKYDPPHAYYYIAYVDPYTGHVQHLKNMDRDFFRIIIDGHFYLWLPPEIGQPIVASATLIFLILMITGIILWWPKNRHVAKQRFKIKFNARWRRINYDLHNVLGFYMSWVGIFLAVTGLVWGFQWFANGLYTVTGGNKSLVYAEPSSDTLGQANARSKAAIDIVWERMQTMYPNAEAIEVHPPETASSPIAANANPDRETYWQLDYRYFDQYTLDELDVNHIYGRMTNASAADKIIRMNYDVHTGAILGIAGKLLMFFGSLIIASLPVTGVLVWLGRKKKKRAQVVAPVHVFEKKAIFS
jgi:uncharacterized iron-regulated membrane protein